MMTLNPRVMIPTQYKTVASDKKTCDLAPVKNFLDLVEGMNLSFIKGNEMILSRNNLPKSGTLIRVFNERNVLKTAEIPSPPRA
jgi:hypothetical protein